MNAFWDAVSDEQAKGLQLAFTAIDKALPKQTAVPALVAALEETGRFSSSP